MTRRRLWTIASAISLFLGVAIVILWVRSYSGTTYMGYNIVRGDTDKRLRLSSAGGGIMVDWGSRPHHNRSQTGYFCQTVWDPAPSFFWPDDTFSHRHNFSAEHMHVNANRQLNSAGLDVVEIVMPHWLVVGVLAILPASVLWHYGRRRSCAGSNPCLTCGYNLTGNTSGTCPECGMPVAGKVERKA